MASFVLSFFPLDVLDEIWHLIESVSEGFLTYFSLIPEQKQISYKRDIVSTHRNTYNMSI